MFRAKIGAKIFVNHFTSSDVSTGSELQDFPVIFIKLTNTKILYVESSFVTEMRHGIYLMRTRWSRNSFFNFCETKIIILHTVHISIFVKFVTKRNSEKGFPEVNMFVFRFSFNSPWCETWHVTTLLYHFLSSITH